MKSCLIVGNPVDGIRIVGPFDDSDDAIAFAEASLKHEQWLVTSLEAWEGEDIDDFNTEAYSQ
jgi:hypothetical protein